MKTAERMTMALLENAARQPQMTAFWGAIEKFLGKQLEFHHWGSLERD